VVVVKAVRAPVGPAFLRRVLVAAAAEPEVAAALAPAGHAAELAVRITGDRELRRLNRQFLGEDQVTDVLSFPSGDLLSGDSTGAHLGDLALSWPAVGRQAEAFGHSPETEAALLAVHGFLHLLGWDHATPAGEREMTRLTLACLARSDVHPAAGRL
jgi:probable rRNA maturation factor